MSFRLPRPVVLLSILLGLTLIGPTVPAEASTTTVGVSDFAFSPAAVKVALGGTVTWQFHAEHTTTSNQGFWNSGRRSSGEFVVAFSSAGNFGYHCMMHPSMTGVVRVPMRATGKASAGYALTWSVAMGTPSSIRFDASFKRVGATRWTSLRSNTAQRSAKFNPARSGTYLVRARTRKVGGGASGWSSSLSLLIS